MKPGKEDHPATIVHPPTIMMIALVLGFAARAAWGGFMDIVPPLAVEFLGITFIIAAIVIMQLSIATFAEGGETLRPPTPSRQLFTKGVYAYTRNPIYVAMMLVGAGLAFATQNVWMLATTALAGVIINYAVILPEERYLEDRFGPEYEEYKARVRRWM